MAPLMTNKKIPRLRKVIGRVRTTMMGRTKALTNPKRSADKIIVPKSSKLIRGNMASASHRPSDVTSTLAMNPRMLRFSKTYSPNYHYARQDQNVSTTLEIGPDVVQLAHMTNPASLSRVKWWEFGSQRGPTARTPLSSLPPTPS